MTQEKAPEWAVAKAKTLVPDYVKRSIVENIALDLSQAYERGQVDMRERAAGAADTVSEFRAGLASTHRNNGDFSSMDRCNSAGRAAAHIATAIRSLPIEQERGV